MAVDRSAPDMVRRALRWMELSLLAIPTEPERVCVFQLDGATGVYHMSAA